MISGKISTYTCDDHDCIKTVAENSEKKDTWLSIRVNHNRQGNEAYIEIHPLIDPETRSVKYNQKDFCGTMHAMIYLDSVLSCRLIGRGDMNTEGVKIGGDIEPMKVGELYTGRPIVRSEALTANNFIIHECQKCGKNHRTVEHDSIKLSELIT